MARYAPAGTKRIARHIVKCLTKPVGAIIMAQHGAVCFGADAAEAFAQAEALEDLCRNLILLKFQPWPLLTGDMKERPCSL